jgi:predicted PurR-regulated permease PerM
MLHHLHQRFLSAQYHDSRRKSMKKSFRSPQFQWGLTAFIVIVSSICFFFAIFKMQGLFSAIGTFIGILKPFIYGATVAYFLLPIYNMLVKKSSPLFSRMFKTKRRADGWAKMISSIASVMLLILLVSALLYMVLPQLATSIISLTYSMQDYPVIISNWLEEFMQTSPDIKNKLLEVYSQFSDWAVRWIQDSMLPSLIKVMGGSLMGTVNILKNVIVGIIIAIYVLNSKDLFAAQAKKIAYSIFSTEHANLFIKNTRFIHRVFGGFITGKLLDSLIIGMITFVFMSVFDMPYVVLISVIIGVTNFIPFFGPFIGAIPCSFLVLMVSPLKCLYFVIFILILQQFDGNILGPKILGDSTGLSSFWVMFAILIAGGLFGFVGMIIGVPLFAVLYSLITTLVNRSLADKDLPVKTSDYFFMDCIDPDTHKPVPFPTEKPSEETSVSLNKKKSKKKQTEEDDQ